MSEPDGKNPPVLWAGLRQVQALRDSLTWSLGGSALPSLDEAGVCDWLDAQGIPQKDRSGKDGEHISSNPIGRIDGSMMDESMRHLTKEEFFGAMQAGRRCTNPDVDDFGAARGGAGWSRAANFCITSGFVRLLAASEQYELDVLRCLFYYRPGGVLGHPMDQELQEAELKAVYHSGQSGEEGITGPPIWGWIEKSAENNVERRKIFKRVFGISTTPKEFNSKRDEWYDKRNAIAHGRSDVTMQLREYVEVQAFVIKSMLYLASECDTKQRLLV